MITPSTQRPKPEVSSKEQLKALTPSENDIRLAMITNDVNKRLGDMSASEMLALTAQIIKTAYTRLGLKQSSSDIDDLQQVIFLDLRGFLYLNGNEVLIALKSGLDGDYSGENGVFFNSSNFVQWLKKYVNGKRREIASKVLRLEEQEKSISNKPPLSDSELKNKLIEVTNQYADMIEANPNFEFIAPVWMLYEDLERLELYSLTIEQKRAIFDKIKELPRNRNLDTDSLKKQARNEAYYIVCKELVSLNSRLSIEGITLKQI